MNHILEPWYQKYGQGKNYMDNIGITTLASEINLHVSTPHESFIGNKPDVSMLHIWGCTAYILVQKDKQPLGSLGSHMEKCIFIGYPDGYKAWKFYCLESNKVIISEWADFDERFFINQRHSTPHIPHPFLTSYHHHLLWYPTQVRRVNKGSTRWPSSPSSHGSLPPPYLVQPLCTPSPLVGAWTTSTPWSLGSRHPLNLPLKALSPALLRPAFVHPPSPHLCLGNVDTPAAVTCGTP